MVLRLMLLLLILASPALATDRYASPSGPGSAPCTNNASPCPIQTCANQLVAGDTCYAHGGTYTLSSPLQLNGSGSSGAIKTMQNYPGELPIVDATNTNGMGVMFNGVSWWKLKGFEVKNAPNEGIGLQGTCSNNIIEGNVAHHNSQVCTSGCAGIQGQIGNTAQNSNNLFLNNDSHHNGPPAGNTSGGDGFNLPYDTATGNVFRGNRAWNNNDDGFDFFDAANITVENNWSFRNGMFVNGVPTDGNGAGFKLGGSGGNSDGGHLVRQNLAAYNDESGFDSNGAGQPNTVVNNTSYGNANSFASTAGQEGAHVYKNNLASNLVGIVSPMQDTFNSWNLAVTVSSADFVSIDDTELTGPRQADGSLPTITFLHLVSGSDLIDKGTDVGLPFTGTAPDLGAFEFTTSGGTAPTIVRIVR